MDEETKKQWEKRIFFLKRMITLGWHREELEELFFMEKWFESEAWENRFWERVLTEEEVFAGIAKIKENQEISEKFLEEKAEKNKGVVVRSVEDFVKEC